MNQILIQVLLKVFLDNADLRGTETLWEGNFDRIFRHLPENGATLKSPFWRKFFPFSVIHNSKGLCVQERKEEITKKMSLYGL